MIAQESFSSSLINKNGIFFSKEEKEISYPGTGNEFCFQLEDDSFWFNHRNNCIIEAANKYCRGKLFFDIGGGNGFVAKGLEDSGISTVLLEPGLEGCLNAQKRNLKNIVCSTLENARFSKGSIPAAGLFDVVEHTKDDVGFLKSVNSFMEDNGIVLITVPAYNFLWSNEDTNAGHFRRYTLGNLEGKLKKAGFKIEYSTYIFSILPIPVFLFRTIPYKFGFGKRTNDEGKHRKEHKQKKGIAEKLLNSIWKCEVKKIKKGQRISFGGSCFVIARKVYENRQDTVDVYAR